MHNLVTCPVGEKGEGEHSEEHCGTYTATKKPLREGAVEDWCPCTFSDL